MTALLLFPLRLLTIPFTQRFLKRNKVIKALKYIISFDIE